MQWCQFKFLDSFFNCFLKAAAKATGQNTLKTQVYKKLNKTAIEQNVFEDTKQTVFLQEKDDVKMRAGFRELSLF